MLKDNTLNKPDNQKWLKAIGLFQIVGGSLGLIVVLISAIRQTEAPSTFWLTLQVLLVGLSIYIGKLTFTLSDSCLKWTTINQILQLFTIVAGSFGFRYVSGGSVDIFLNFTTDTIVGVDFHLSCFQLFYGTNDKNYFMSINLVAVFIIYKIEKIKTEVNTKKELRDSLQKHNA